MSISLFCHDYETFGLNTRRDRPAQFAGVRLDENLNIIEDPMMFYCKPALDILPGPYACMVTGITPQLCEKEGLSEFEFAKKINKEFSQPSTIRFGYNTINYDDEITRFMFWRNLIEPYSSEWKNGCGRWDIIDMVRASYSLRPEGIVWPQNEDGRPSFKLEDLSKANGLAHDAAHDAMSDVHATIALAKLIKEKNPKLYAYAFSMYKKDASADVIAANNPAPFVHISRSYGHERGFIAAVMPIQVHPTNKNEIICWDLSKDPSELLNLDAQSIKDRLFAKREDRGDDFIPMPIVKIATNKSPMVMKTLGVLKENGIAEKWGIDLNLINTHAIRLKEILASKNFYAVFEDVYHNPQPPSIADEDLYGGFLDRTDRAALDRLNQGSESTIITHNPHWNDSRLDDIFANFKARNFFGSLNDSEMIRWREMITWRFEEGGNDFQTLTEFNATVEELLVKNAEDPKKTHVLNELKEYALQVTQFCNKKIKSTHKP